MLIRYHRRLLRSLKKVAKASGENGFRDAEEKSLLLLKRYEAPILRGVRDLFISSSPILWYFSSENQKKKAYEAFDYLFDAKVLGMGPEAESLFAQIENLEKEISRIE